MDLFCDSTVLVAAMAAAHPHHNRARLILESIIMRTNRGLAAAHSLAEMYTALTRMPVSPRIHPKDAEKLIQANIVPHLQLVYAYERDYLGAISMVANLGLPGGKACDALILQCAAKSGADRILTFNTAGLIELADAQTASKISAP